MNISAVVLAHGHPETSNFLAVLASGGTCALLGLLVVLGILEVSGFLKFWEFWRFGEFLVNIPSPNPAWRTERGRRESAYQMGTVHIGK